LLAFLFIAFILYTAIGLTFKLKVLSLEEKKELRGTFTVKWLLFSPYLFSRRTMERENMGKRESSWRTGKIEKRWDNRRRI